MKISLHDTYLAPIVVAVIVSVIPQAVFFCWQKRDAKTRMVMELIPHLASDDPVRVDLGLELIRDEVPEEYQKYSNIVYRRVKAAIRTKESSTASPVSKMTAAEFVQKFLELRPEWRNDIQKDLKQHERND